MTDDAELLGQYANDGSEAAFAELVRRHVDLVYAAALRQMGGDHHRARDVTQMVFVDLARKAASLVRHPVLSAWLYRASYLEAANARRREGRRQKYERTAGAEAALTADRGSDTLAWEEVRPVLDEAMNEMNERDRQAVLLRFFSNRPFVDIGRQLGLTENAARMRVERALGKLHEFLGRRGITSSAAALAAALAAQAVTAAPAGIAAAATGAALTHAGAAGIIFMTTAKLPLVLTAALVLGGAGIGVWQMQSARRADRELADLARQNRAISALNDENRRLAATAEEARELREDTANLSVLQKEVREAAAEAAAAAPVRNLANAHAKSTRVIALGEGNPAFEPSQVDRAPKVAKPLRPQYPPDLLQAGVAGQVVVDLVVGADGSVYNAYAASSTDPKFEDAAVQAVSQWTFTPGQKGGQAVNTHLQIPFNFTPNQGPTGDAWF